MRNLYFLKMMLLLCALVAGRVSAWVGTTVIKENFNGDATYKAVVAEYSLTMNKKESGLAWSVSSAEAILGKQFNAPVLTISEGLPVTYVSSIPNCASINSNGVLTIRNEGTTVITASFAGNSEYNSATASYTLTVLDPLHVFVDFTKNPFGLSSTVQADNQEYTLGGVTFILNTSGGSYNPKVTTSLLHFYANNTLKIEAPSGHLLSSITFKKDDGDGDFSVDNGTYTKSSLSWSGSSSSVTFTNKSTSLTKIKSIDIKFASWNVTIGETKYATFSSTKALNLGPTDVKAYKAKANNSSVILTEITDGVVPGSTGVILYCERPGTYAIPVTMTNATMSDNEMVATVTRTLVSKTTGTKYNYILQSNGEGGIVFNMARDGGNYYMPAGKAYLSTAYDASASDARLSVVFANESQGIAENENGRLNVEDSVYDMQGRKIVNGKLTNGLYIVNGKKVLVK